MGITRYISLEPTLCGLWFTWHTHAQGCLGQWWNVVCDSFNMACRPIGRGHVSMCGDYGLGFPHGLHIRTQPLLIWLKAMLYRSCAKFHFIRKCSWKLIHWAKPANVTLNSVPNPIRHIHLVVPVGMVCFPHKWIFGVVCVWISERTSITVRMHVIHLLHNMLCWLLESEKKQDGRCMMRETAYLRRINGSRCVNAKNIPPWCPGTHRQRVGIHTQTEGVHHRVKGFILKGQGLHITLQNCKTTDSLISTEPSLVRNCHITGQSVWTPRST